MTDKRAALVEAAREFRQFSRSQAGRSLLEMLDALDAVYSEDLRNTNAEGLGRLQGACAQVKALRRLLTTEDATPLPRI